jgi:hypothetical protein
MIDSSQKLQKVARDEIAQAVLATCPKGGFQQSDFSESTIVEALKSGAIDC